MNRLGSAACLSKFATTGKTSRPRRWRRRRRPEHNRFNGEKQLCLDTILPTGSRAASTTAACTCLKIKAAHCTDNNGEEPQRFRPERFLAARDTRRHPYTYFPFSGGPRGCGGDTFTLMNAPLVLASIAQRFRVQLLSEQAVVPDPTFTLRPRGRSRCYCGRGTRSG